MFSNQIRCMGLIYFSGRMNINEGKGASRFRHVTVIIARMRVAGMHVVSVFPNRNNILRI